jgi:vacuolar-type H+-ATPase subunit F/Vma7
VDIEGTINRVVDQKFMTLMRGAGVQTLETLSDAEIDTLFAKKLQSMSLEAVIAAAERMDGPAT